MSEISDLLDGEDSGWRQLSGIFAIVEVQGATGERIREIQQRFDPKLAATTPPHITLVGSSGLGPIRASTTVEELRRLVEPITSTTPPLALAFDPPMRFMQTKIVVLPLDPHGILRILHERIARSGLTFGRARFAFTPHATLNFYRTLPRPELRELLALRVPEPVIIDHVRFSLTDDPNPPRDLLELPLTG